MEYPRSMQESKNLTQDLGYQTTTQNIPVIEVLMPTCLTSKILNTISN